MYWVERDGKPVDFSGLGQMMKSAGQVVRTGAFNQVESPEIFGSTPPFLPLSSRHDVLVFSTQLLKEDVEVTGPISVTLWISSSASDTDFTAKLIDVYPPSEEYPSGYAMNLSDSSMRARFHQSYEKERLLQLNQIYKLTFQLNPTSNLFVVGHARARRNIAPGNCSGSYTASNLRYILSRSIFFAKSTVATMFRTSISERVGFATNLFSDKAFIA